MTTKSNKVRVNVRVDKLNTQSRTERAVKIGQLLSSFPLYQQIPTLKEAMDALLRDGASLATADDQVAKDEAQAMKSRAIRDAITRDFDASYDIVVSNLEKYAQKPADVESAGFLALERTKHQVMPPRELKAEFDYTKNVLQIRVKRAKGMQASFVEISPDPIGPNTYKRLDSIGTTHELKNYAPGTYWIRAASVRGAEMSPWLGPISVTIK